MAEHTKKCAHPACNCIVTDGSKFCSTYCSGQEDNPDITCSCGHDACNEVD